MASSDLTTRHLEGQYVCGGTIPNAFCDLEVFSHGSQRTLSHFVTLTFEEVFGEPPPSEGETNFAARADAVFRPVPEPSTALLLAFGLVGLAAGGRSRAA